MAAADSGSITSRRLKYGLRAIWRPVPDRLPGFGFEATFPAITAGRDPPMVRLASGRSGRGGKTQMLVKVLGGLMLAVGAFFALRMLFDILVAAVSIAFVAALLYFGWRLFSGER